MRPVPVRPCRPETPARHSKQAAPGTQGGRVFLCGLGVCVCKRVGEKGNRTQDGGSRRGESCDGRAILYYGNRTNNPRATSRESRSRAMQGRARQIWFRPDGTGCACVLIREAERRSGGPKCPIVASASRSHSLITHPRLSLTARPCLRAGGLAHVGSCWRRWYRYFGRAIWQGLPAQIHF